MSDPTRTFRVSPAYLRNVWNQGVFLCLGFLSSWVCFLAVSIALQPAIPFDQMWLLPARLFTDPELGMLPTDDERRDLIRFGLGPALIVLGLMGGLADMSSWIYVRYEIFPDVLRMRWRRLSRQVQWDLIQSVDEGCHQRSMSSTLVIQQNGEPPILVRGLDTMPELIDILKSRLPRLAHWKSNQKRVDLTSLSTNFWFGFGLVIPIWVTWIAFYVARFYLVGLVWAIVALPVSLVLWFRKPLTRSHVCAREIEVVLAIALLALSGVLTGLTWSSSTLQAPSFISRWISFW